MNVLRIFFVLYTNVIVIQFVLTSTVFNYKYEAIRSINNLVFLEHTDEH
jgi:hypothetical protein